MVEIERAQLLAIRNLVDWLRTEYDLDKSGQKLEAAYDLTANAFVSEVKKRRGRRHPLSSVGLRALREEHDASIRPLREKLAEADRLERRIGDLINAAYGLTPEEIGLMWKTAPPRMPINL